MKLPRLFCPRCGLEIAPDEIDDQTKDSGYALSVEVQCSNPQCGQESIIFQK
jgi:ribosomal protein S27AE